MSDRLFFVCPDCEYVERADEVDSTPDSGGERRACPDCGSERAYLNHAPAWPDASVEAAVKLDANDGTESESN